MRLMTPLPLSIAVFTAIGISVTSLLATALRSALAIYDYRSLTFSNEAGAFELLDTLELVIIELFIAAAAAAFTESKVSLRLIVQFCL